MMNQTLYPKWALLPLVALVFSLQAAVSSETISLTEAAELATKHIETQTFEGTPTRDLFVISRLERVIKFSGEPPYSFDRSIPDPKIAWKARLTDKTLDQEIKVHTPSDESAGTTIVLLIYHDRSLEIVEDQPIIRRRRIVLPRSVTKPPK